MPRILFVCVHNAGRSQMAAAIAEALSAGQVEVRSAGSEPADELNPRVIEAMSEIGIELADRSPSPLDPGDVREADVVVSMGCGDACPTFPGKRYEDWRLDDPAKLDLEGVRRVRSEITARVRGLLEDLGVEERRRLTGV